MPTYDDLLAPAISETQNTGYDDLLTGPKVPPKSPQVVPVKPTHQPPSASHPQTAGLGAPDFFNLAEPRLRTVDVGPLGGFVDRSQAPQVVEPRPPTPEGPLEAPRQPQPRILSPKEQEALKYLSPEALSMVRRGASVGQVVRSMGREAVHQMFSQDPGTVGAFVKEWIADPIAQTGPIGLAEHSGGALAELAIKRATPLVRAGAERLLQVVRPGATRRPPVPSPLVEPGLPLPTPSAVVPEAVPAPRIEPNVPPSPSRKPVDLSRGLIDQEVNRYSTLAMQQRDGFLVDLRAVAQETGTRYPQETERYALKTPESLREKITSGRHEGEITDALRQTIVVNNFEEANTVAEALKRRGYTVQAFRDRRTEP